MGLKVAKRTLYVWLLQDPEVRVASVTRGPRCDCIVLRSWERKG